MIAQDESNGQQVSSSEVRKRCPWCGGVLGFRPRFPVRDIIPGGCGLLHESDVPEELKSVAAWVCETAHCRYRETARPTDLTRSADNATA